MVWEGRGGDMRLIDYLNKNKLNKKNSFTESRPVIVRGFPFLVEPSAPEI